MNTNDVDRREQMLKNVRATAQVQETPEYLNNYLSSCEAHGGVLAEVAVQVRQEMKP
jgi:hypothetical protein